MRISLVTNNHEICDYVAADGVSVSTETRNEKTVTTLDGTLYKSSVEKLKLSITCLDMSDSQWHTLSSWLKPSPITIAYTNLETGQTVSGLFYVTDRQYQAKKTVGTITYLTGISFTLTEK